LNLLNRGCASRSLKSIMGLRSDEKRLQDSTNACASNVLAPGLMVLQEEFEVWRKILVRALDEGTD
jgi:hypothetical protein